MYQTKYPYYFNYMGKLLLVFLLLLGGMVFPAWPAVAASDIVIDGNFDDWIDGDGNEFCVDDEMGADDWSSPARFDITKFCLAGDSTGSIAILFGLDDVSISGGNTATACVLINTDYPANSYVDFVLCVELTGPGRTSVTGVTLFSCDDSLFNGCGSATQVNSYPPAAYGFDNSENGPFGDPDSLLEVPLPFSDLGFAGGDIVFSSLVSYAGTNLLTSPKDSIFGTAGQDYEGKQILYNTDTGTGVIIGGPGALRIVKKAYLFNGSPVPDGTVLPRGTLIKYLIYINNKGRIRRDVSVRDVLDPTFAYQGGTIKVDNSVGNCTAPACTQAEETAIFNAVDSVPAGTDTVDGDVVSYDGAATTIYAGNQNAANGQLNIAPRSVFALSFTVKIQ